MFVLTHPQLSPFLFYYCIIFLLCKKVSYAASCGELNPERLKARLTSDAVTGKIDVRGIEIPEFEYMEETYLIGKSDEQDCEDSTKEEK